MHSPGTIDITLPRIDRNCTLCYIPSPTHHHPLPFPPITIIITINLLPLASPSKNSNNPAAIHHADPPTSPHPRPTSPYPHPILQPDSPHSRVCSNGWRIRGRRRGGASARWCCRETLKPPVTRMQPAPS
ncbi:hypothetical protein EX30DRAFT_171511 [Ascodesmis nigricans]|uniref:Uncharacterized protein n=1 Tax=Ascodesmis nigricans TaxID=341454 RepID=A0A4S2MLY7_9PEZI|nr:hypothetical protein EX30DRAFT_171511 [Ascodesmis nigricans]